MIVTALEKMAGCVRPFLQFGGRHGMLITSKNTHKGEKYYAFKRIL